ncbi:MAG: non-canonical purine NTP pyrophosphatase [Planctomycetes bacterium]|nr:non-canonical purine NTP pyrophosphatase [Planctomycetota bacterium]
MTVDLWIASGNRKKRLELERLLGGLGYRIRTLDDAPPGLAFVEDRPDFAGNAEIKATGLARVVHAWALGDDSGLCVDALDGEPGVRSARWAGEHATDADRIGKLLDAMRGRSDRRARFVCSICLAAPDGSVAARFEDVCEGVILEQPRGTSGFGYDPAFAPLDPAGRALPSSFAELDAEAKDRISHRGRALRRLSSHLARHPLAPTP